MSQPEITQSGMNEMFRVARVSLHVHDVHLLLIALLGEVGQQRGEESVEVAP